MQQTQINKLIMLNWNANGLINKVNELKYFLQDKKIDFACITETHLNSSVKFTIPDYKVIRTDRQNNNGGGVMILIKSTISCYQIILPPTPGIETAAIKFNNNNNLETTLIVAYKPPI